MDTPHCHMSEMATIRPSETSSNKTSGGLRVLLVEKHQFDPVFAVALLLFRQVKM